MSRRKLVTTVPLALAALLVIAAPAAATTHVVHPGQSIQAAIDASSPGDKIVVKPGTYHQYLQIVDKDRITLKGEHARLKPPSTVTPTLCNSMGELTGICVVGRVGPPMGDNPPTVLRRSVADRITGLKVSDFGNNGIFAFGTRKLRADRDRFTGNGEYGLFADNTVETRLDHNVAKGNKGEAGLYVGDSPSAHALITRNKLVDNHGEGLLLRSASRGKVTRNRISGNCAGILVLADEPGPAGHWAISRNRVSRNNRACAGGSDEPALSGIGIFLAGADHTKVTRNRVQRNRHRHKSEVSGGIIVTRAHVSSGTAATDDVVSRNVAFKNSPFDIRWDDHGSDTFSHNSCGKSKPTRICG